MSLISQLIFFGPIPNTNFYTFTGVVAFDETSGFWLVHSTPHFPPPRDTGYAWPSSARIYGQTFLCVSMDTRANLDIIGENGSYLRVDKEVINIKTKTYHYFGIHFAPKHCVLFWPV